jgi:Ca2+-binding EF-hand superfamily protein
LQESEGLDRTELESIKRVFERLDRKNDGKIDRDEIAQQFDILGKNVCAPAAACKLFETKWTWT